MKKQINTEKTTITVEEDTRRKLLVIKNTGGYKTVNEVIKVLLGEKQ
jgi:predicted CopG family antitoxin